MRRDFPSLRRALAVALVGGIGGAAAVAQTLYPQTTGYEPTPSTYPAYQPTPTYPSTSAAPVQPSPAQQPYAPAYVAPGPYAAQTAVGPTYAYPRVALSKTTPPQPHELPMPGEEAVPDAPKVDDVKPSPASSNSSTGDYSSNQGASTWSNYMTPGGCDAGCDSGCDGGDLCAPAPCRQWFFGIYGLYMDRDNPDRVKLTASVDSPPSYPYYPPDSRTVLWSDNADLDELWGAEIRLGSTFGCGSTCDCQCQQPFAWEVGYWGLAEDESVFTTWDDLGDTDRYYGMVNFAGIEYDRDGAGGAYGYRPINDYFDHQMPIEDPMDPDTNEIRVLAQRVRSSFSMQNVELNLIRFPLCNYGVCCGGCDDGCNSCCPSFPRFSMNGLCGLRYMRFDEDFQYGTFFSNYPTAPGDPQSYPGGMPLDDDNVLLYDISVDNDLVGFQLGSSMCWNLTCRCAAFWDTTFGLYNNHISHYQRLYNESGGVVRFQGTGENFAVRSSKDDVAFVGEARVGLGYQVSCNCRLTAAYRVIGIGGVALAVDQIPSDFSSAEHVSYIDSNDSIILHGVQFGTEFKY